MLLLNAIYNEIDPGAAAWLKGLADAGRIVPGRIDTRSVEDLTRADVDGPGQRHFFAGIGGWSLALRYAGVPDDADVWTGSCPCQPFSQAGRRKGNDDARHLWPAWFKLIDECRPPIVFGEQVASAAGFDWLSAVRADLEGAGYAVGGADLPACGVGAPHKRQRLFFVAYADGERFERLRVQLLARQPRQTSPEASRAAPTSFVGNADSVGHSRGEGIRREARRWSEHAGDSDNVAHSGGTRLEKHGEQSARPELASVERSSAFSGMGDTGSEGSGRDAGSIPRSQGESDRERQFARCVVDVPFSASPTRGQWQHADWLLCRDGKARAVEPGTFPLAHGVPGRVGLLRGYGNAIVAQVGASFVVAFLEAAGLR